ncbi:contact-dependent growth inhibition system immunity protein [Achromobacter ruhlandii]|uniref:contact-dependent growth inhibition system immunity protein n=1 Tax=Achromobacter ruhlandii TaxID=72557 RepID=UPI001EEE4E5D|nr:contact-dependent growth inhibition system immunity protein [Achromobacter ruhlandii]MCZ8397982.1 contact-dependent growth inhibition system immunity protein [Achromobacter ruhlandii]
MQKFSPKALVLMNDKFYSVDSLSVGLINITEPDGFQQFLPPDESNQVLGSAVRRALAASKPISLDKVNQVIDSGELKKRDKEYESLMMRKFGYTGKRALYKSMKFCSVSVISEGIEFQPTHRKGLDGFTVRTNLDLVPVIVPQTASDMELGLALREAFTRCT